MRDYWVFMKTSINQLVCEFPALYSNLGKRRCPIAASMQKEINLAFFKLHSYLLDPRLVDTIVLQLQMILTQLTHKYQLLLVQLRRIFQNRNYLQDVLARWEYALTVCRLLIVCSLSRIESISIHLSCSIWLHAKEQTMRSWMYPCFQCNIIDDCIPETTWVMEFDIHGNGYSLLTCMLVLNVQVVYERMQWLFLHAYWIARYDNMCRVHWTCILRICMIMDNMRDMFHEMVYLVGSLSNLKASSLNTMKCIIYWQQRENRDLQPTYSSAIIKMHDE